MFTPKFYIPAQCSNLDYSPQRIITAGLFTLLPSINQPRINHRDGTLAYKYQTQPELGCTSLKQKKIHSPERSKIVWKGASSTLTGSSTLTNAVTMMYVKNLWGILCLTTKKKLSFPKSRVRKTKVFF